MGECSQPSLFDQTEGREGHQQAVPLDPSTISSRSYEHTRHLSQAALDQGWGWQPAVVSETAMTAAVGDGIVSAEPLEQSVDWQPPTEEQKQRIRALIATTREGLRRKQL